MANLFRGVLCSAEIFVLAVIRVKTQRQPYVPLPEHDTRRRCTSASHWFPQSCTTSTGPFFVTYITSLKNGLIFVHISRVIFILNKCCVPQQSLPLFDRLLLDPLLYLEANSPDFLEGSQGELKPKLFVLGWLPVQCVPESCTAD
jgi:hypothetical protein